MNIINKITIQCLKENKRRTIVTVLGASISVALIFSMMITAFSFMDMVKRNSIANGGDWTFSFNDVPAENVDALMNHEEIDKTLMFKDVGYAKYEGGTNLSKPYVYLQECDMENMDLISRKAIRGRLPENANEIVVTEDLLSTSGAKYEVNDIIALDFGNRYHDQNSAMNKHTPMSRDNAVSNDEYFDSVYTKEYKIVGIVKNLTRAYFAADYPVYTKLENVEKNSVYTMYTKFNHIDRSIYDRANELAERYDVLKINDHSELLMAYGISENDTFITSMVTIVCVLGVIILIGSISLIYNAFAISLAQRSKYLGMLSSIGATKRQIRNSVMFEALIIAVLSIPLGLLIGYIGMSITYFLLADGLKLLSAGSENMRVIVNALTILISVIFSTLVLIVSAWLPSKRAGKITPISAIRQNEHIKINAKGVRTWKAMRKLLGFEKELALKNIKRNRSRYYATLFSLIISFVLFISAFSFMNAIKSSVGMSVSRLNFDIKVSASINTEDDPDSMNAFFQEIEQTSGYTNLSKTRTAYYELLEGNDHLTTQQLDLMEKENKSYNDDSLGGYVPSLGILIHALDDTTMKRYMDKSGLTYQESQPNVILLNEYNLKYSYDTDDEILKSVKATNYKAGDILHLKTSDAEDKTNVEVVLTGTSSEVNDFQQPYVESPQALSLFVDEKTYAELFAKSTIHISYYYTTDSPSSLESKLFEIKNSFMDIEANIANFASMAATNDQLVVTISVFLYGFVALILLICMANIFNTISTGIMLRRQEFAMLKSVGMNQKAFKKMIAYESIFYGIKAIIYGVPSGLLCSYIMYIAIKNSFHFTYVIPMTGILIISGIVMVMVSMTMIYSMVKVKNDNIVETIKNENL